MSIRRNVAWAVFVYILLVCSTASGQSQSPSGSPTVELNQELLKQYSDVFELYKAMRQFQEEAIGTGEFKLETYHRLMGAACVRLTTLAGDRQFADLLRALEKQSGDSSEEARGIFREYRRFIDYLALERSALLEAGLTVREADHILGELHKLRSDAESHEFTAEDMMGNIQTLATHTCRLRTVAADKIDERKLLSVIGNVALGLGGITLGVVDVLAAIPVPATLASELGAGALIGTAASNLLQF